eukprot:TRINITY_DN1864_c0_g1_i1.p1 TRINITY_DN1864_c0_g1~~TRINITY_DN1864_c0_g1_i1.p1  ORF type:complete len:156 (-),score=38.62 TRINITY_DN1864_c0_g1_i1:193-660(-)
MGRDSRSRSRGGRGGGGGDKDRIQQLVDDRQAARKDKDFDKADRLRDELRSMNVNVDDTLLTWRGPDGQEGTVSGGGGHIRRDGDWNCPKCGLLVFASKNSCFKCGADKPRDRSRGGRGGGRRSSRDDDDRYDRRDRRRRDDSRGRSDSRDRRRR